MPASKRVLQLVLGLLALEDTPRSCQELQESIKELAPELANLIPKSLLKLWQKKVLIRSSKKINGRYQYYLSSEEQRFSIAGSMEKFVLYTEEKKSEKLKQRILEVIEKENIALKLKDVAEKLETEHSLNFLKKVQFHLSKLVASKKLSRTGKPHQYYLSKREDIVTIDQNKASIPEKILSILKEEKLALASSEISEILNFNKLQAKPSAISLALTRLVNSGRLQTSSKRLGARNPVRGHLFAVQKQKIDLRLEKIMEAKLTE